MRPTISHPCLPIDELLDGGFVTVTRKDADSITSNPRRESEPVGLRRNGVPFMKFLSPVLANESD